MIIFNILKEILQIFIEISPYMLLGLFFVGLLHILFSKNFMLKHIGKDSIKSTIKASVLGVPLPLCSCGVIPSAVYMSKNGASKGAVISFLISTPQTGIDSIIATYGLLGWVFAIYRPVVAFISGIIGGIIVNLYTRKNGIANNNINNSIECSSDSGTCCSCSHKKETVIEKKSLFNKTREFYRYAFVEFLDDITTHLLIGIIISGIISFLIPADLLIKYNLTDGFFAYLFMILIGLPMYICATSSIPIALALMLKGISPGAVFVFLSVGPLTNAASLTVLIKIFKKKILFIYVLSGTIMAVIGGVILDKIFYKYNLKNTLTLFTTENNYYVNNNFHYVAAFIFTLLILNSFRRKLPGKNRQKTQEKTSK